MIIKTHDVFCDRCPMWCAEASSTDGQGGATEARKAVRAYGWVRRNGEDLCPNCQDPINERK